jgi:hypothetical protein
MTDLIGVSHSDAPQELFHGIRSDSLPKSRCLLECWHLFAPPFEVSFQLEIMSGTEAVQHPPTQRKEESINFAEKTMLTRILWVSCRNVAEANLP